MANDEPHVHKAFVLSDLQIAVMRVLWERGETTTAQVARALADSRGLAHTTVSTVLTRLEARGVVTSRRVDRQVAYRAQVPEAEVKASMVGELIATAFQGSAGDLVAHLLGNHEIGASEIAEMRRLLEGRDR